MLQRSAVTLPANPSFSAQQPASPLVANRQFRPRQCRLVQLAAGCACAAYASQSVHGHLCGSVQMKAASTSLTLDSPRTRLMQYVSSSLDSAASGSGQTAERRAQASAQGRAGGG
jgi:hypothetical protein